jgi:hypothetical protein
MSAVDVTAAAAARPERYNASPRTLTGEVQRFRLRELGGR